MSLIFPAYLMIPPGRAEFKKSRTRSLPRREVRPFETLADVQAVDVELPPRPLGLAVFAAETGLRPEEWIPLRTRDLDLAAGG